MLLDTNALIWLMNDSPKLGPQARARIVAAPRVYYSSVSVMEIVIKSMLGKLALPGGERFPDVFAQAGLVELPFSARQANALREDEALARHDPFDRMLLAQARVEAIPLLTSDTVLLGLTSADCIDARH